MERMLEQVRPGITSRLNELLGKADKLRRALAAQGSRETPAAPSASSPPKARSRRPDSTAAAGGRPKSSAARADPGATNSAILAALDVAGAFRACASYVQRPQRAKRLDRG